MSASSPEQIADLQLMLYRMLMMEKSIEKLSVAQGENFKLLSDTLVEMSEKMAEYNTRISVDETERGNDQRAILNICSDVREVKIEVKEVKERMTKVETKIGGIEVSSAKRIAIISSIAASIGALGGASPSILKLLETLLGGG